jgi:hypothetical protein
MNIAPRASNLTYTTVVFTSAVMQSSLSAVSEQKHTHLRILYSYFVTFYSPVFIHTGAINSSSWYTVITVYTVFPGL